MAQLIRARVYGLRLSHRNVRGRRVRKGDDPIIPTTVRVERYWSLFSLPCVLSTPISYGDYATGWSSMFRT